MSSTEMFCVPRSGPIDLCAEFKNSWGSAMFVWVSLTNKYFSHLGEQAVSKVIFFDGLKPLLDLFEKGKMTREETLVFGTTLDNVIVERNKFLDLAECFDIFDEHFNKENKISHMKGFAKTLRVLTETPYPEEVEGVYWTEPEYSSEELAGVCWNQTTVVCGIWQIAEDSEEGETRWYDISRDKGHWFLYQEVSAKINFEKN